MAHIQQVMAALPNTIPNLTNESIDDIDAGSGSGGDDVADASVRINSDGTVDSITGTGGTVQINADTDWMVPNAYAASYASVVRVKATLQSGDTPTGTVGTALDLTSDQTWTITQTGSGLKSCSLLIEILGTNDQVLASATYDLSATVP